MSFLTDRRSRQLVMLTVLVSALALAGALVAYADSTDQPSSVAGVQAQGDATPTSTPAGDSGAQAAVLGSTEVATPTATYTPTTPPPVCTPPACQAGEVLHCPGDCPGGCGTVCATPTPGHPSAPPDSGPPGSGPSGIMNVIENGSFEQGFVEGVGVAVGWERFENGNVKAGWYDDTWEKVVHEGEHAQLLELKDAQEQDRYVGIYQTVHVAPDATYELTMHGLVRSDSGSAEASNHGFEMQYGIDYRGGTDWQSPDIEWIILPWEEQSRTEPTRIDDYTVAVDTKGPGLTLFIRALKKWPDMVEGNYDVDAVSLVGPQRSAGMKPPPGAKQPPDTQPPPGAEQPPDMQPSPPEQRMPETGNQFSFLENPVLVVASAALLLVLAGGAFWGLVRRRA